MHTVLRRCFVCSELKAEQRQEHYACTNCGVVWGFEFDQMLHDMEDGHRTGRDTDGAAR